MPDDEIVQEPLAETTQEDAPSSEEDVALDVADDADIDTTEPSDAVEPADLDALWTRYPALREQFEATQAEKFRERELAGANRERARLQREAGKKDSTRQNVSRVLTELGYDVSDTARLDYFYELAAANSAYELAQAVPEAVLRGYTVPVAVREQALEARERGDWDGYVGALLTGAVEAQDAAREAEFESKVTAEVNRRLAAEIKARNLESAPRRERMPAPPAAAASSSVPYHLMTPEQRGAMSPAERDAAVAGYGR